MTEQTQEHEWHPHISDFHPDTQARIDDYAQRLLFMIDRDDIRREFRHAYRTALATAFCEDSCDANSANVFAGGFIIAIGKRIGELRYGRLN